MPVLILLIAALFVPVVSQAPAQSAYPKKMGIYAMTSQGPVELKISGERSSIDATDFPVSGGTDQQKKCYYSPSAYDKIPAAESVRSFYVNAMGWEAKDVYLVVGREFLSNSRDKYQRLAARIVSKGAVAFEIVSVDLETPEFLPRAIKKLAPDGVAAADLEVYLVIDLRSTAGMAGRSYPVKLQVPKGVQ